MTDLAVLDRELRAGGEVAREDDPLRAGRDVDEAADAGRDMGFGVEAGDVHVAVGVDLEEGQERAVEAAALQIRELVRRRQQCIGVLRTSELEAEERHAADRALLDHPGDRAIQPFLEEDARHERGDAEPEVDRLPVAQLLARAPGDDLLGSPRGELELGDRRPIVAGGLGQQDGLGGLQLIRRDDDRIDHDPRAHGRSAPAASGPWRGA